MAAMFITKNALFRFSKSFPNVPSISLPKPSRVFFASASNHSDVSLYFLHTSTMHLHSRVLNSGHINKNICVWIWIFLVYVWYHDKYVKITVIYPDFSTPILITSNHLNFDIFTVTSNIGQIVVATLVSIFIRRHY
jgi:hypothetical protein